MKPFSPMQLHTCGGGGYQYSPISEAAGFLDACDTHPFVPLDVRLFVTPGWSDFLEMKVKAAVRFSEYACGARGLADNYVHGGAIESVMDEVTAECARTKVFAEGTTLNFECAIKRKVEPHTTYLAEAEVGKKLDGAGIKYEINATLKAADGKGAAFAVAKAVMVNVAALPGSMESRYKV